MAARTKRHRAAPQQTDLDARLRTGRDGRACVGRKNVLSRWLESHPAALADVDRWLALRARGDSPWSVPDMIDELVSAHGMPRCGASGLQHWLRRNRGALYGRSA